MPPSHMASAVPGTGCAANSCFFNFQPSYSPFPQGRSTDEDSGLGGILQIVPWGSAEQAGQDKQSSVGATASAEQPADSTRPSSSIIVPSMPAAGTVSPIHFSGVREQLQSWVGGIASSRGSRKKVRA